ncbi:MAG: orotidine-5'-phosphate decarboxylase [Candidatus Omnitrophica bacterium]|nr:orotidine-5'-phosphate decarboxylase [Candidatus Omnitrophota bacterium]MBU4488404.1 orotidine-5'-phosphate decarboxylase [Candidatus Omnitrophota bacterium]MCG2705000.1 orotidine-5'-phosphate decarboxylase [Candidatus Omnitrophota bacterium]
MGKGDKIIIALDVNSMEEMEKLVSELRSVVKIFKIGSELFASCGFQAIDMVRQKGGKIFLDLKFHDIPNTVIHASRAITRYGIHMFTVHTMGGFDMMKGAVEASREEASRLKTPPPLILGVTILTSMSAKDISSVGIDGTVPDEVLRLAKLAEQAGLSGVVASPREVALLRKNLKKDFLIVTPGVRPLWSRKNDQERVATPKEAIKSGADYLVIGRPITAAEDPKSAAEKIISEIGD